MTRLIRIKIDVTKINKTDLYRGAKDTYLDASVFLDDEPDQYDNNGCIRQDVPKDRRDAVEKGAILGNVKLVKIIGDQPAPRQSAPLPAAATQSPTVADEDDDIPF